MHAIRERFTQISVIALIAGCLVAEATRAIDANVRLTLDLDRTTVVALEAGSTRVEIISKDGEIVVTMRY